MLDYYKDKKEFLGVGKNKNEPQGSYGLEDMTAEFFSPTGSHESDYYIKSKDGFHFIITINGQKNKKKIVVECACEDAQERCKVV